MLKTCVNVSINGKPHYIRHFLVQVRVKISDPGIVIRRSTMPFSEPL